MNRYLLRLARPSSYPDARWKLGLYTSMRKRGFRSDTVYVIFNPIRLGIVCIAVIACLHVGFCAWLLHDWKDRGCTELTSTDALLYPVRMTKVREALARVPKEAPPSPAAEELQATSPGEAAAPEPVVLASSEAIESELRFFETLSEATKEKRWAEILNTIRATRRMNLTWFTKRRSEIETMEMRAYHGSGDRLGMLMSARSLLSRKNGGQKQVLDFANELRTAGFIAEARDLDAATFAAHPSRTPAKR
jgi:hypothetical protein